LPAARPPRRAGPPRRPRLRRRGRPGRLDPPHSCPSAA
jgi:hypothetical protein